VSQELQETLKFLFLPGPLGLQHERVKEAEQLIASSYLGGFFETAKQKILNRVKRCNVIFCNAMNFSEVAG